MGVHARHAHTEKILREEGYTVFDIPRLHASEVRRTFEGRAQEQRIKDAQETHRRGAGSGSDGEVSESLDAKKQRMKANAKQNAIDEYKEDRGLV